jgi:hypothetical protein
MVQFRVLSGKQAGNLWVARRFPVQLGRAATADLKLEGPGVWERHAYLELHPAQGILLTSIDRAIIQINGQVLQNAVLHNGDTIDLGSVRLQFWLTETRQVGLGISESFTWTIIVGMCIVQISLLYWLLR